jgi:hypothetical protein
VCGASAWPHSEGGRHGEGLAREPDEPAVLDDAVEIEQLQDQLHSEVDSRDRRGVATYTSSFGL